MQKAHPEGWEQEKKRMETSRPTQILLILSQKKSGEIIGKQVSGFQLYRKKGDGEGLTEGTCQDQGAGDS